MAEPTKENLDLASAYQTLSQKVYVPVFFSKLAQEAQIVPENEAQAQELLKIAVMLRAATAAQQKQAGAASQDAIKQASAELEATISHLYGAPASTPASDPTVLQYADQALQDPLLKQAVEALIGAQAA